MPKISVLMPIYKTNEVHLKGAIDSILAQTMMDFEFLILNDSPDATYLDDVVKSYKDKRIKYLKNDKNMGITPSRNKLIDLAKGEYLAVMDHDDISLPERFEKQAAYLDQHPDVGVVSCWAESFGDKVKQTRYPTEDIQIKLALMKSCAILHPASMIRRKALGNLRYEEQFSPAEDYGLWCRLIAHTNFHNLGEVLFHYRLHNTNTSKTQSDKMLASSRRIWAMVKTLYPALYEEFLLSATRTTDVRFWGVPLFKVVTKANRTKVYLFEKLPLFSIKTTTKLKGEV